MKVLRLTLVLSLAASTAYAMNAPDDMKLGKLERGAVIVQLPAPMVSYNPKAPVTSFAFHFRNGGTIPDYAALDGTIRSDSDPRITPDNVTCSVFIDQAPPPPAPPLPFAASGQPLAQAVAPPSSYSPMPPYILMSDAMSLGVKQTTLSNGAVLIQQQAASSFSWTNPRSGATTEGQLICYKVGEKPMTTGDLRHALNGNVAQIQLSASQSSAILGDRSIRNILNDAGRSLGSQNLPYRSPGIVEDPRGPKQIYITGEQTEGSFVGRPAGQYPVR